MNWEIVEREPCPLCAVWVGPHLHSVRDDGTYGALVIREGAPGGDDAWIDAEHQRMVRTVGDVVASLLQPHG